MREVISLLDIRKNVRNKDASESNANTKDPESNVKKMSEGDLKWIAGNISMGPSKIRYNENGASLELINMTSSNNKILDAQKAAIRESKCIVAKAGLFKRYEYGNFMQVQ